MKSLISLAKLGANLWEHLRISLPVLLISSSTLTSFTWNNAFAHNQQIAPNGMRFIQIAAQNKEQRSEIANLGVSIEAVRSDSVWGFANEKQISKIKQAGFKILGNFNF